MKLVIETAGIADGVSVVVASPQWRNCRTTILTGDRDAGRRHLAWPGAVLSVRIRALAGSVLTLRLALCAAVVCLRQSNLRSLADAVVVCWASVAAIVASSAVAATSAGACAVRCCVGDVCCSSKLFGRRR